MDWQTLTLSLNKDGAYVPFPLAGEGGRIPIEISAFGLSESGSFEVGIYSLPPSGDAALVAPAQQCLIARYRRHLIFEVPPGIEAPHLGARLLKHPELQTKSYSLSIRWQKPFGSGSGGGGGGTITIPPPQGLVIAATLEQVTAAVDARRGVQIEALEATFAAQFEDLALPDPDLVSLFEAILAE